MKKGRDPDTLKRLEDQFLVELSITRTQKGLELALALEKTLTSLLNIVGQLVDQLQFIAYPIQTRDTNGGLNGYKQSEAESCSSSTSYDFPQQLKEDS